MGQDYINTTESINAIKGRVSIELFNHKTKKLVDTREDNNFIAIAGVDYLRYIQRINFKSGVDSLSAGSDVDLAIGSPFQSVTLSDYDESTDQSKEIIFPGVPVGYANKSTYSGPDLLRGTPNALLCETSISSTKWVFDWPTHAANGTIGSVGWTLNNLSFTTLVDSTNDINQYSAASSVYIAILSENRLAVGSGTSIKIFDLADNSELSSFLGLTCNGLAWDSANEKIWVISNNQIASYDDEGNVIDSPRSVANRTYRGLTYDGTDLWTTNGTVLYRISISGADLDAYTNTLSTETGTGYSQYITDVAWDDRAKKIRIMHAAYRTGYLCYRRLVDITDITTGSLSSYHVVLPYMPDSNVYRCFDIHPENQKMVVRLNSTNIDTLTSDSLGTLVALSAPIVKTDSQTLRVTYQLDYN